MKNIDELVKNRAGDVEEGAQHDMTQAARELGFPLPLYVTSAIKRNYIKPDQESREKGEDEKSRLKQILDKLIYEIRVHRQRSRSNIIKFEVSLTRNGKSEKADFISYICQISKDNKNPCITITLQNEIQ